MTVRFIKERACCPKCGALFVQPQIRNCPNDGSRLQPMPEDPLLGKRVACYEVLSVLAEGGTGRIYRATSDEGEIVALKILYGELAATATGRRRFCRSATFGQRVNHANVVKIIDTGETEAGIPFLVTPLLEGQLLSTLLRENAPLPTDRACALFREVCLGVEAIHACEIVHRNLTAENIFLCQEHGGEVPQILDFGIAISTNATNAAKAIPKRWTRAAKIVGTASYLSPERIRGKMGDTRSDLFSLGVLFYRMLSGVFPYVGAPILRVVEASISNPPTIKERTGRSIHPSAEAIARRLIQSEPADRYPSTKDVIDALDACLPPSSTIDSKQY